MAESWAGGLNTGLVKGLQIGSMFEEGKARKEARKASTRMEERKKYMDQLKISTSFFNNKAVPDQAKLDEYHGSYSDAIKKLTGKEPPQLPSWGPDIAEYTKRVEAIAENTTLSRPQKFTAFASLEAEYYNDPRLSGISSVSREGEKEKEKLAHEKNKRLATQLIVEFKHNKAGVEPGSDEAKELATNFYNKLKEIDPRAVGAATEELNIVLSGEDEGATTIPYEREKPLTTAQRKSEWAEMRAEELRGENRWSEREITGMVLTELNQKFPSKTGTDVTVNLGTSTKQHLEKEIIDADSSIANFDSIESSFNPAFLTYGGKLKAGTQRVLDKAGFASNTQFLEERATWFSQAMSAFIAYRKWATGVAGGEKELAQIAKAYPDPEKNSPAEYKANLKQSRITARKLKIRLSMFRLAGIDNPTKAQLASIPLGSIPDPLAKKNIDIGDRNLQDLSDRELQELKQ